MDLNVKCVENFSKNGFHRRIGLVKARFLHSGFISYKGVTEKSFVFKFCVSSASQEV